jgi:hypothetical protein
MIGAASYATVCQELAFAFRQRYAGEENVLLVGFLFARPTSKLVAEEIVPNLAYFHRRSADHADFFCGGYGMFWPNGMPPDKQVVAKVGKVEWLFSEEMFDHFRDDIEQEAKNWRYSGGVDLILANARYQPKDTSAAVDFNTAVLIDLDKAKQEEAFANVEHLFEDIIRYAQRQNGTDPAWGFSDRKGSELIGSALKQLVLSTLPKPLRAEARKAFHFFVRDLTAQ